MKVRYIWGHLVSSDRSGTTERDVEMRQIALGLIKWEMERRGMNIYDYSDERMEEAISALLDALKKARGTLN